MQRINSHDGSCGKPYKTTDKILSHGNHLSIDKKELFLVSSCLFEMSVRKPDLHCVVYLFIQNK